MLLELRIPAREGKLLAEVHRSAQIVASTGDVLLTLRASPSDRGRWERPGVVR